MKKVVFGSIGLLVVIVSGVLLFKSINPRSRILPAFTKEDTAILVIESPVEVQAGRPFSVNILVNTNNATINAMGVYLRFEPSKLQLTDIDTTKSFCQFYPEKRFDNQIGLISLACGSPHPGSKGKLAIMELKFRSTVVGTTSLRIDPKSMILRSDGKGTNILREYPAHELRIKSAI